MEELFWNIAYRMVNHRELFNPEDWARFARMMAVSASHHIPNFDPVAFFDAIDLEEDRLRWNNQLQKPT